MLRSIRIKNFVLIDSLQLNLSSGLTTMTGETGAGKSILLGALQAALGGRLSGKKVLKDPNQKAVVELEMDLPESLKSIFEELDLDFESTSTFRRELLPSGKSRFFINDTPAKSSDMQTIAGGFIDINSQSDTGLLHRTAQQIELIDSFGVANKKREAYARAHRTWRNLKAEKQKLLAVGIGDDLDYLQFLYEELLKSQIVPGEDELIENELSQSKKGAEQRDLLKLILSLVGDEGGALDSLFSLEQQVNKLIGQDSSFEGHGSRILDSIEAVRELESAVSKRLDSIEFEVDIPSLEKRKSVIQTLLKKHRVLTVEQLLHKRDQLAEKVERLSQKDARLKALEDELVLAEAAMRSAGEVLQQDRLKASEQIEVELAQYLERVDLPHAKMRLVWEGNDTYSVHGLYTPVFEFSANPGQPMQSLAKVASGGEQSRVKLALKAVLGKHAALSTQIFDEIDTGISGATADKVGNLLAELAEKQQMIAITHLPQVAAKGKQHWLVYKEQGADQTSSFVKNLEGEERVIELARMLSGEEITESAKMQANALLLGN